MYASVGSSANWNLLIPTSPTFYYFERFLKNRSIEVSETLVGDSRDHGEFFCKLDFWLVVSV